MFCSIIGLDQENGQLTSKAAYAQFRLIEVDTNGLLKNRIPQN